MRRIGDLIQKAVVWTGLENVVRELYLWATLGKDRFYRFECGEVSAEFLVRYVESMKQWNKERLDEEDILRRFLSDLQSDDVFFDVGSRIGLYSCLADDKMANGLVVAFEPAPFNVFTLTENFRRNDVDGTIVAGAASSNIGLVRFDLNEHPESAAHRIHLGWEMNGHGGTMHAPCVTIDQAAEELGWSPDVIKIDVEGHELEVLSGMKNVLEESVRVIYVEVHDMAVEKEEVISVIEGAGFSVDDVETAGKKTMLRGEKQ